MIEPEAPGSELAVRPEEIEGVVDTEFDILEGKKKDDLGTLREDLAEKMDLMGGCIEILGQNKDLKFMK